MDCLHCKSNTLFIFDWWRTNVCRPSLFQRDSSVGWCWCLGDGTDCLFCASVFVSALCLFLSLYFSFPLSLSLSHTHTLSPFPLHSLSISISLSLLFHTLSLSSLECAVSLFFFFFSLSLYLSRSYFMSLLHTPPSLGSHALSLKLSMEMDGTAKTFCPTDHPFPRESEKGQRRISLSLFLSLAVYVCTIWIGPSVKRRWVFIPQTTNQFRETIFC